MSNTSNDEQKGSQERLGFALGMVETGASDCSPAPGDLDTNWQSLANLALKVLSCTNEARKKAREASGEYASRANMLSQQLRREGTQGGNVASNSNESGGVDTGSKVFGVAPETIPQRAPDTDERNSRKDPTSRWSVDW